VLRGRHGRRDEGLVLGCQLLQEVVSHDGLPESDRLIVVLAIDQNAFDRFLHGLLELLLVNRHFEFEL